MNAVSIRLGRAEDLAHLDPIDASAAETFARHGHALADGSPAAPPGHWAAVLAAGLLWIADESQAGPVGFLAAERIGAELYIDQVSVHIDHQQHGHGRRLMLAATGWARAHGLAAVALTTFRAIPWNGPFYASLGFIECAPSDIAPHVAAHLASEGARGLVDRCAMRLAL